MSLDVNQVEQLNRKAQTLNSERQRLIGMKESARQAYDKAIFAYKQKYGVELDDTNLQEEYNTVKTKLEQDYNELNKLILSIESGEYKNPTPSAGVTAPTPDQTQAQTQPQTQAQTQPTETKPTQQPQTVSNEALAQASLNFQQPAPAQQQSQPQVQPQGQTQVQTNQPIQPVFGQSSGQPSTQATQAPTPNANQNQEDVSEQAFTPQGWGNPNQSLNQNFQNILGESNGSKFGE